MRDCDIMLIYLIRNTNFIKSYFSDTRLKLKELESFIKSYFSQNQKGFGCICAAVLLILSPKQLI